MDNKYYIGIDPGINGGLCCLDQSGNIRDLSVMPTMKIGTRHRIDPAGVAKWIRAWMSEEPIRMVAIERQTPMHKQGLTSTFTIGIGFGMLEGIIATLELPYEIIIPNTWQRTMFAGMPKQTTKAMSKSAAQRLFPKEDFLKTKKCKVMHDGMTDAALIAEYIRRKIK